jgi:hypothetical protein
VPSLQDSRKQRLLGSSLEKVCTSTKCYDSAIWLLFHKSDIAHPCTIVTVTTINNLVDQGHVVQQGGLQLEPQGVDQRLRLRGRRRDGKATQLPGRRAQERGMGSDSETGRQILP